MTNTSISINVSPTMVATFKVGDAINFKSFPGSPAEQNLRGFFCSSMFLVRDENGQHHTYDYNQASAYFRSGLWV